MKSVRDRTGTGAMFGRRAIGMRKGFVGRIGLVVLAACLPPISVGAVSGESDWENLRNLGSGITEPIWDATLSASVAGRVAEIPVEEGDKVQAGETLIRLDDELEKLEVERRRLIWESKVEVESAKARAETLKLDLEGTRRLYETTRSVSQDELKKKELEHLLAVAEHEKSLMDEKREEIEYKMALEQLRRREIVAPRAGQVAEILIEEGESCESREPLIRVVDTTRCYLVTNLDAADARSLRVGQPVKLRIEAGERPVVRDGTISFISPVVDPASGLQEVKAVFDNADGEVRPGVAGSMYVDGDQHAGS